MFRKLLVLAVFLAYCLSVPAIYAGEDTIPKKVREDLVKLFKTRDKAVNEKDQELYLETQMGNIPGGSVSGHMSLDKMETNVLTIVPQQDDPELACVAFVRQIYFQDKKESRRGFLIYYLLNTKKGWKVIK